MAPFLLGFINIFSLSTRFWCYNYWGYNPNLNLKEIFMNQNSSISQSTSFMIETNSCPTGNNNPTRCSRTSCRHASTIPLFLKAWSSSILKQTSPALIIFQQIAIIIHTKLIHITTHQLAVSRLAELNN